MGAVVIDTSVVIGHFDSRDAHHPSVERVLTEIWTRGDDYVLPANVLAESMVGRFRRDPGTAHERQVATIALFGDVRIVDEDVAIEAARLRAAQPALRLPDALVIATGIVDDAAVLTCDARWAAVDRRVRVVAAG
jgi:PIN domain nuclease of toxin-antitoxin system